MPTPRHPLAWFVALLLAAGGGCTERPQRQALSEAAQPAATKPSDAVKPAGASHNVVLISIDTLRRDHLGVYGYARDTSPNLDRLAKQSVVFDSAIAVHTNTAPSHASMMTGLYPGSHGIRHNGMKMRAEAKPLAELLKARGYATAGFISGWTLHPMTGINRGFDVYDAELHKDGRRSATHTWEAAKRWFVQDRPKDRPFFLFFHLFDPHYPYRPPSEILERFLSPGRTPLQKLHKGLPGLLSQVELTEEDKLEYVARYDAEIALADHAVGQLLAYLDSAGLRERTLVIVTSDHGETLFERAWVLDHGGRAYDEQIRVPMIVRLPSGQHAGTRVSSQVSHVDILPTVAQALELELSKPAAGRSMLPLAGAGSEAMRPAFAHGRPEPKRVPEIAAPIQKRGLISVVRLPNAKLLEYPTAGGGYFQQLFLLDQDSAEVKNVASAHAELVDSLHLQLEDFRRATRSHTRPPMPKFKPEVEAQLRALGYVE